MPFEHAGERTAAAPLSRRVHRARCGRAAAGLPDDTGGESGKAVSHRRAPPFRAAGLLHRAESAHAGAREVVRAGLARRDGQERHPDRFPVAHQSRHAGMDGRCRGVAQDRAHLQRIRGAAHARPSWPLRVVRVDSVPGRRGQSARDRVCVRHAEGRRHLSVDELQRQAPRRSCVLPDSGGAEPPQGRRSIRIPRRPRAAATSCLTSRSTRSRARWTRRARW